MRELISKPNECRRPGKDTPKETLRNIHKQKVMGKFFRNVEQGRASAKPKKGKK